MFNMKGSWRLKTPLQRIITLLAVIFAGGAGVGVVVDGPGGPETQPCFTPNPDSYPQGIIREDTA